MIKVTLPAVAVMAIAWFTVVGDTAPTTSLQDSVQEIRTIEPRYTRVFGSDTLNIMFPEISPDGRWIAFSDWKGADPESVNLWLVPGEGGDPVRLTEGPYWDDWPVWFPASDRIAFRSDRPARPGQTSSQIMTLQIDTSTGRPVGPPRQVTLKGSQAWYDVSPDGKWIAYTPRSDSGRLLDLIPAGGGVSRTLIQSDDIVVPVWSADGQSIYWQGGTDSWEAPLMRISVAGGDPDTVLAWPTRTMVFAGSDTEFIVRGTQPGFRQHTKGVVEIADMEGEPLARFEVPDQLTLRPSNFGHEVLAVVSKEATSVHIMPVDGGAAHAVTEGAAQDRVLDWSGDGKRLLIRTELDGEPVLFLAQRSGSAMHQIRLPDTPLGDPFRPILSHDGDYLLYGTQDGSTETAVLKVYGIEGGQTRVLTRETMPWASATGAGGVAWRDGRRFLYTEKIGESCVFRASTPEGPSELLVTLPCADVRRDGPAVHGDRVAYARDSTLYLARAGETRGRALVTLRDDLWAPAWSHDGSRLAVAHHDRGADRSHLVVLDITQDDKLAREPLILDSGAKWWWAPQWLPDDSAVLLVGLVDRIDGAVWLVPMDPNEPATPLTLDEGEIWDFVLSPDGNHIAFSKEAAGTTGSSIWRVDLSEAFQDR